jgi:hypothetical protein
VFLTFLFFRYCNCDVRETCLIIDEDVTCGCGWQMKNMSGSDEKVYQSWQFYGNGVWYTPTVPYYSNFFGSGATLSRGIGYLERIWSLRGHVNSSSLLNATVVQRAFDGSDALDPFSGVSVVPMTVLTEDSAWMYASSTQLVFVFDRLVSGRMYTSLVNGVQAELTTKQWCVGTNGPALVVRHLSVHAYPCIHIRAYL